MALGLEDLEQELAIPLTSWHGIFLWNFSTAPDSKKTATKIKGGKKFGIGVLYSSRSGTSQHHIITNFDF